MEPQQKRLAWFVALIAGIILFLKYLGNRNPVTVAVQEGPASDFYSPYYYTSPGVYPDYIPPESVVNVYVDRPFIPGISDQYMPVFGFVGMTAV